MIIETNYPKVTIGSLAHPERGSFKIGPFGSSLKKDELVSSGIPVVGIENVLPNRFVTSYRKFITEEKFDQLSHYEILHGDILVTTMGTIGRAAVVPQGIGIAIIDSHLFRMRVDQSKVYPQYLCYGINGYDVLQTEIRSKSSGAIMAGLNTTILKECSIPLPPLYEQKRIAAILDEKMAAVERARAAAGAQLEASKQFINAVLRESINSPSTKQMPLQLCINEVTKGIGESWSNFPVLGATRAGLAPAKEGVGKSPQRYKPVTAGTIFYNPMRILLGSIAMIDEGDEEGITSPDYVVFRCKEDILHNRWFYNWLRSPYGEDFIKSMSRGAVRERMLFKRLAAAEINIPSWQAQLVAAEKLRAVATFRNKVSVQLETINKLPAALLRQAFTGQL